ncbi:hypothetical protein [Geothermobacter hydrogeniphilus]|uniref:Uncharacterized protein n=1 Tax=Geothermobacter hydrogeniphilus TaxID=1969733 RepID=A0A1X0Y890_9BACT|nr:hypothetical protein [Geothermobacter hydrogeniphilus]ORJ61319.1 hypothetical protein B5V00_06720 [Geothermobacter hydrogeniphilus]
MRLEPGMLIQTNYSGPYRIKAVLRDCTCPSYLDEINGHPVARRPHIHLVCTDPEGPGTYYLNGWDEQTLQSLQISCCGGKGEPAYDRIIVLPQDRPVQGTLF